MRLGPLHPEDLPLEYAAQDLAASNALQDDVGELLTALGLGNYARLYSAHEVIQRDILPRLRADQELLRKARTLARTLSTMTELGEVAAFAADIANLLLEDAPDTFDGSVAPGEEEF